MKQMIAVRSNAFFAQDDQKEGFELKPELELVLIFTNGAEYDIKKGQGLIAKKKLDEVRMIVNPELLSDLITDLQLHQKKLEAMRKNGDQINSLIKHITEMPKEAEK